jgi:uncharacterized protein (DUF4415 family)
MSENDFEMAEDYDMSTAQRGPVVPPARRQTQIALRIDTDILEWFRDKVSRQSGGNYQAMMNQALREYMARDGLPLESLLRQIVHEEVQQVVQTHGR